MKKLINFLLKIGLFRLAMRLNRKFYPGHLIVYPPQLVAKWMNANFEDICKILYDNTRNSKQ